MTFRTWVHNLFVGLRLTDWIIAGFTAALAVVAIMQYREMKRAGQDTHVLAEQAVVQSKAALMQATMSQQTFDAIFHPSVEVSSISFNQQAITVNGIVSYTLKNVGGAPAEKLSVHVIAMTASGKKDVSPTVIGKKDISPKKLPSELGVGATFTDDPKVSDWVGTQAILDGHVALKLSFTIAYAAHDKPVIQQCTMFTLEPAKREMVPTGECK